jgi:hypothetical protein
LTATIHILNHYRQNDLNSRAEALLRDAGYIYEASLILAIAALELQMLLMGYKLKQ